MAAGGSCSDITVEKLLHGVHCYGKVPSMATIRPSNCRGRRSESSMRQFQVEEIFDDQSREEVD